MKKYIFAIYTTALIFMIPAIFIAYLNHNNSPKTTQPVIINIKPSAAFNNDDGSFKPGLIFILKGI